MRFQAKNVSDKSLEVTRRGILSQSKGCHFKIFPVETNYYRNDKASWGSQTIDSEKFSK